MSWAEQHNIQTKYIRKDTEKSVHNSGRKKIKQGVFSFLPGLNARRLSSGRSLLALMVYFEGFIRQHHA